MVHRNANPSFTHQPSHGDCSPPLSLNQHCLLNSTPFPRFWSCFGREMLWSGLIPCRVFRQCLWGKRGSPCMGFIPGEVPHKSVLRDPAMPLAVQNPSPATQDYPKLMTACLKWRFVDFRPVPPARGDFTATPELLVSQFEMKFSFLQSFSFHSHVCFGVLQSLNAHSNAVPELWAVPVEQEISNPVGHTFPGDLAHRFGLVFNSPTF